MTFKCTCKCCCCVGFIWRFVFSFRVLISILSFLFLLPFCFLYNIIFLFVSFFSILAHIKVIAILTWILDSIFFDKVSVWQSWTLWLFFFILHWLIFIYYTQFFWAHFLLVSNIPSTISNPWPFAAFDTDVRWLWDILSPLRLFCNFNPIIGKESGNKIFLFV